MPRSLIIACSADGVLLITRLPQNNVDGGLCGSAWDFMLHVQYYRYRTAVLHVLNIPTWYLYNVMYLGSC